MVVNCPAINHSVAIFPDGKIRPCCLTAAEYSKPISEISNPDRFSDLRNVVDPVACKNCVDAERNNNTSYRNIFLKKYNNTKPGLQFVDFRHSNQCNLKCRYCSPHFSNQWAKELGYDNTLVTANVKDYYDLLLTDNLIDMYWCGGEPLILADHYDVLQRVIAQGQSHQISLRYNTNLSVIQYKDVDLLGLWKNFKSVDVSISLDAAGPELNYIRSGSNWQTIAGNIDTLLQYKKNTNNLRLNLAVTVSMLNIWFLPELYAYAQNKQIPVSLNVLYGPDYLSVAALYTDELKQLAIKKLQQVKQSDMPRYNEIVDAMGSSDNEFLFAHAIRHILLLDNIRNEKMFELLPFKEQALKITAKNSEYE